MGQLVKVVSIESRGLAVSHTNMTKSSGNHVFLI
jgi:hypothetical protein